MEVKIKNQNELIDATIEMVDGIMVVSPKEVFEPKDGDVIVVFASYKYIAIYKKVDTGIGRYACFCTTSCRLHTKENVLLCTEQNVVKICPATEEEKKLLFDKLAEEGFEWDAEKKKLVKLKWKPQDHEKVYVAGFTFYGSNPFCAFEDTAYSGSMQWRAVFERGWYFKTEQECQEFCNRLNKAIENIKP